MTVPPPPPPPPPPPAATPPPVAPVAAPPPLPPSTSSPNGLRAIMVVGLGIAAIVGLTLLGSLVVSSGDDDGNQRSDESTVVPTSSLVLRGPPSDVVTGPQATTPLPVEPDATSTVAPGEAAAPITAAPATTTAATTVPVTTVPVTTVPVTTVPVTTVPVTTVPVTTVPATTVPVTTVPATTVAPTTTVEASSGDADVPESKAFVRGGQIYLEGAVPTAAAGAEIAALAAEILGADNVFNNYVVDERAGDPNLGNVTVEDTIRFASGSSVILSESEGLLNQGLALLTIRPTMTITIVGHTDALGAEEFNTALSLKRADAVKTWFTDRDVDPARLTAVGKGESEPIADNETQDGRRINRRIQFFLENILGAA